MNSPSHLAGKHLLRVAACDDDEVDEGQQMANACLIAAAPDLLAELRRIYDRLVRQIEASWPLLTGIEHDDYVRIAKVLSKATPQATPKTP